MSALVFPVLIVIVSPEAQAVPSFTRETGLKCSVCHSTLPELTALGRKFKLEGYTLTDKKPGTVIDDNDLKLSWYVPISVMLLFSDTVTNKSVPGAQNGSAGWTQRHRRYGGSFGGFPPRKPISIEGGPSSDLAKSRHILLAMANVPYF